MSYSGYDTRGRDWDQSNRRRRSKSAGANKRRGPTMYHNRWEISAFNRACDDSLLQRQMMPLQQPGAPALLPEQQQPLQQGAHAGRDVFLGPVPPLVGHAPLVGQQPMAQAPAQPLWMNPYYSYLQQPQTGNPLIDMIIGFSSGKIPSNELVHQIGDITREVLEERRNHPTLDKSGQKTARDLEAAIESLQRLIAEKNGNEKWQKFIVDAQLYSRNLAMRAKEQRPDATQVAQAKVKGKELSETARGTLSLLVNLLKTLVQSHEFRSLILDSIKLAEDISAQGGFKGKGFGQQSFGGYQQGFGQQSFGGYQQGFGQQSFGAYPQQSFAQQSFGQGPMGYGGQQMYGAPLYGQQQQFSGASYDQRRELALRFRTLLERLSENPDFVQAMRGIFALIDNVKALQSGSSWASFNPSQDQQSRILWADAKSVLYDFVGQQPLESFLDRSWYLMQNIRNDQQSRMLFADFRNFITTCLRDPAVIRDPRYVQQSEDLINRFKMWSNRAEYRQSMDGIYNDLRVMGTFLQNDTTSIRLGKDLRVLGEDLMLDPVSGKFNVSSLQSSLMQLRYILAPLLFRHLDVIHIPRIAGENNTTDFMVEDLILHGRDILPDHISFRSTSSGDFHFQKNKKCSHKSFITMEIKHWGIAARQFKFYINKFAGFPKWQDEGIADFKVSGRNNIIVIVWKAKSKDGVLKFSIKEASCHIEKLKIRVLQAKHGFLDKLGVALMKGSIKKKLEAGIVNGIVGGVNSFNTSLNNALLPAEKRGIHKWKYEKGAFGIPEGFGYPPVSETYVTSDPYATRFGKETISYQ